MSRTPTTFDGTTGVSTDVFIRSVRQNSLREGKEKDDEWIALSAASWLEGEALEWYEDQTEETQESWKLLRRAILVRWPASRAAGQPLSADPTINAHIPTPAAAPPVLTLIDRALVPARFAPSSETGRIRVIKRTGDHLGYISSNLGRYGDYYMRTDLSSAVVVKFTPSLDPHELIVVGPREDCLGVAMVRKDSTLQLAHDKCTSGDLWWFTLSDIQRASFPRVGWVSRWTHKLGYARGAMWTVLRDGRCRMLWETGGRALYPLDFVVIEQDVDPSSQGLLQCTNNIPALMSPLGARFNGITYAPVEFIFESL